VAPEITRSLEEEDEDEPETVLAGSVPAWEEAEEDAATVQVSRMPVGFISEAVMDDHTVADKRLPPGWRQMLQDDEKRATPPPPRPRSGPTAAVPGMEDDEEEEEGVPATVWIAAVLLLAAGAVVAALMLV
jgi:hypothetical protein